jgi:phospholipid/cholesterol/gamma-HCH transport system ATP-binding protein
VEVAGLSAGYGENPILQDVSFRVSEGETLAIVGASGCGKSTLLRCIIGLLRPVHGTIRVLGREIWGLSSREMDALRRQMGVAFQGSALLNSLTVGENVSLPLREHTPLDAHTIRIMTRMKLEQVGLRGLEDKMPAELSGGMRKRAGIARALTMDPKVLFLDEPSAGLDPITAAGLDDLLVRLRHAHGLSLIVVTHELTSVSRIADRVLMLDGGRVRIDGKLADVEASSDPRVRQFFDRRPDPEEDDRSKLVDELTR